MELKKNIPYEIKFVSSEDPEYPAVELFNASSSSKGWQTERYCIFPQTLILKFQAPSKIDKMQFISHQCKIATKIEIHLALPEKNSMPLNIEDISFKKLGYFLFSSNEENNFQAREMKTVFIDAPAFYVKFVLHMPYPNSINLFNQVGVFAIQFSGTLLEFQQQEQYLDKNDQIELQNKVEYDEKTLALLNVLERQKKISIRNEDYEESKVICEKIKNLKLLAKQLRILEDRKREAVLNEDFNSASVLKNEIFNLKKQANIFEEQLQIEQKEQQNQQLNLQENQNEYEKNLNQNQQNQISQQNIQNPMQSFKNYQQNQEDFENNQNFQKNSYIENKQKNFQDYQTPQKNNQNQNFQQNQLKNQSQMINYDERVIPTFLHQSKKKLQEFEDENQQSQKNPPKLDKKALQKVNYYSEYFEEHFLQYCFSSVWKDKNDQCEILIKFMNEVSEGRVQLPNEFILVSDLESAYIQIWKLNNEFLDNKIPKLVNTSFQLFQSLFLVKERMKQQLNLNSSPEFYKIVSNTIFLLMDKSGESKNEQNLQQITEILLNFLKLKMCKVEEIIETFCQIKGLPKQFLGITHLVGRLFICLQLINKIGGILNINQWHVMLKFAIENYDKIKEVRELAHKLILKIYQVLGEDETMRILQESNMRENQLEKIQKDFEILSVNQNREPNKEFPQQQKKKIQESYYKPQEQVQEKQNLEESISSVEEGVCQFCKRESQNFLIEENFNMHLFKECPFLFTCQFCQQVIEIKDLEQHYSEVCKSQHLFTQCENCNKIVLKEELENHQQQIICQPFKKGQNKQKCALCSAEIQWKVKQEKNKIWRKHLLEEGCPNNPRTSQNLIKIQFQVFKIISFFYQVNVKQN